MTRLTAFFGALGMVLGVMGVTLTCTAQAQPVKTEDALKERVLGQENAPVTIVEYSSLACPHCASFHRNTLPQIKKNFIDTGKAKLIYRDFPLGGPAYIASMMARCARPDRYFQFIDYLFKEQDSWARSQDPVKALARIGKLGGMSQADFDACTKNEELYNGIRNQQLAAQDEFKVNATPTFVINGKKISGAQPYEVFAKAIESAAP